MTEQEDEWKSNPNLMTKRKTLPFEPTPLEEQRGETSWTKFKKFLKPKKVKV